MNKLFAHIKNRRGLPQEVFDEAATAFSDKLEKFRGSEDFIHCHLLLAAMYQDVGELPFQKVTSLFFRPDDNVVQSLQDELTLANPTNWSVKMSSRCWPL